MDRFEDCLTKSLYPKMKLKFKPHSTYFGDGVSQSQVDTVAVQRLFPLPIRKFVKHPRLLIIHMYALMINPTHKFGFLY